VLVASVLALAAGATAFIPLLVRQHDRSSLPPMFAGTTSVYAVPLAGGAPRRVLRLHGQWAFPVVEPGGRSLLLERPTFPGTLLWRVPLDGSAKTRLGALPVFAQVGFDDDRSEYAAWGTDGVAVRRLDGSRVRSFPPSNTLVSWNGDYLAGEQQSRPASTGWRLDIHVIRSDGTKAWSKRMPFPAAAVAVARDGRRVAAVRMHLLELVTPRSRRVLARDAGGFPAPVWTPDDRSLVYFASGGRLVVQDVATGDRRVLVRGRYFEPAVSPDGRTVYVLGLKDAVSIPK
jgi:hypothetical protein